MKKISAILAMSFCFLLSVPYTSYADVGSFPAPSCGRDFPRQSAFMTPPYIHHETAMIVGMRMEHMGEKRLRDLGLDEKQRDAIREIKSRVLKDVIKKRAEIEVARVELLDTLGKDPVDISVAEAIVKKIASLTADIHLLYIKEKEAVKSKLTPEQGKRLNEPPQPVDGVEKK